MAFHIYDHSVFIAITEQISNLCNHIIILIFYIEKKMFKMAKI